jgi:hypothetical protein
MECFVPRFSRISTLCAALALLIAQAPAPADSNDDGGANFCTRFGRNIGLDETKFADGKAGWSANALNFGQRFFVGGTAATTLAAEPADPATIEDYKQADSMCAVEGKGAVCRLAGPVNFRFGWKGNTSVTPVHPGEKATVRVEGTKAFCTPGAAG